MPCSSSLFQYSIAFVCSQDTIINQEKATQTTQSFSSPNIRGSKESMSAPVTSYGHVYRTLCRQRTIFSLSLLFLPTRHQQISSLPWCHQLVGLDRQGDGDGEMRSGRWKHSVTRWWLEDTYVWGKKQLHAMNHDRGAEAYSPPLLLPTPFLFLTAYLLSLYSISSKKTEGGGARREVWGKDCEMEDKAISS